MYNYTVYTMIEVKTKLRKWGNSLGIVIPRKETMKEHMKEGEQVTALVLKNEHPLEELFGTLKFKKSTEAILQESDREAWDE